MSGFTRLPDGSGFAVMSGPLPEDHWLYAEAPEHGNIPPMPWRIGTDNPKREEMVAAVREAAKYAVRCATINGSEEDFDPDALVQNMVVGMLGYFTGDGLSHDGGDPDPVPPLCGGTP